MKKFIQKTRVCFSFFSYNIICCSKIKKCFVFVAMINGNTYNTEKTFVILFFVCHFERQSVEPIKITNKPVIDVAYNGFV